MSFLKKEKYILIAAAAAVFSFLFKSSLYDNNSPVFNIVLFTIMFFVIISAAFSVVRHAEILAHKFGEPYGTMILTFSAVAVEIIMITTMMLHGDEDPSLARDTIFTTLMILINGLIGLTMFIGGLKFGEQHFNLKGSASFLSSIFIITGAGMFLPAYISPASEPAFEICIIIVSILIYGFFIKLQSKEHSYFFTYSEGTVNAEKHTDIELKNVSGTYHIFMLVITIALISILAEYLSITVDDAISIFGLPEGLAALIISLIIVSPEGLTAIRAGVANDMQRSINISLGSALSTVMLTIPAILLVGKITGKETIFVLTPVQSVMIILSLSITLLSTSRGETNSLQGFIHFVIFLIFIVLIFL